MNTLVAFVVGAVFAVGLGISGMTQPEKVIGFLDFFGAWDATLVFVMGGAVVTYTVFYRAIRGTAPILTQHFQFPTRRQIDRRLIVGSAMFGIGWGLAGFCPGPALTSVGNGGTEALLFVAAMVTGMYAFEIVDRVQRRLVDRPPAATQAS